MISFPNAKINIGLNIIEKRADGYHNLETIFYPIQLYDILEIVGSDASQSSFTMIGNVLDCENIEDNLIYKAYSILKKDHDIPSFNAFLKKIIPTGAGLGGGSADAAFMISMLNEYAGLNLTNEKMEEYAAKIGADCAVFIQNRPVFAEGIGNIFAETGIHLKGYYLYLVKPNVHVSTKIAYANISPKKWDIPLKEAIEKPISQWRDLVFNDFEANVFKEYPELSDIKQAMYDNGAVYAAMSGSGSSIFGIYGEDTEKPNLNLMDIEQEFWIAL